MITEVILVVLATAPKLTLMSPDPKLTLEWLPPMEKAKVTTENVKDPAWWKLWEGPRRRGKRGNQVPIWCRLNRKVFQKKFRPKRGKLFVSHLQFPEVQIRRRQSSSPKVFKQFRRRTNFVWTDGPSGVTVSMTNITVDVRPRQPKKVFTIRCGCDGSCPSFSPSLEFSCF